MPPCRHSGRSFSHQRLLTASLETGPKPRHQIDYLRLFRQLPLLQSWRFPFQLAFDHPHQVVAIFVGVLSGLPFRAQALHELTGHAKLRRPDVAGLREAEVAEVRQFIRETHHREHERVSYCFDCRQVLGVPKNDLGDADFSRLADRLADQRVRAIGALARLKIVRRLEIPLVDFPGIDEIDDVDRFGLFEGCRLEIILGQDDELALLVLEPFDQVFPGHGLPVRLAHPLVVNG